MEIDSSNQRISLGLKQAQEDPWNEIVSRYPVGIKVSGKVTKTSSFGAFVEIEDGIDGLVHISQISDDHVEKVKDVLSVGDEIEARVVKVDASEHRIGLSIKLQKYQMKNLRLKKICFKDFSQMKNLAIFPVLFRRH